MLFQERFNNRPYSQAKVMTLSEFNNYIRNPSYKKYVPNIQHLDGRKYIENRNYVYMKR